ncbi:MAG TPA: hypothetical protein VI488_22110 [Candidatus Angelobacter sp.]
MDPVKIIIIVAALVVLLLIGRRLSASSEVHAASLPRPGPAEGSIDTGGDDAAPPDNRQLPLTGAEFGFPFRIPPVIRLEDGTYNRPNFVDYHFSKTDLVRGPGDPECFFDELSLKAEDPVNGQAWTYYFTVATPSGLRKVMDEEKFASLYLDGGAVIVPRWDLNNILHTVVDEIMKAYGHKQHEAQEEASRRGGRTTQSSQDVG